MNRQLGVVILLCIVLPVQAELSLKEVRTASNNVLVAYFQSDVIKADEVDIGDVTNFLSYNAHISPFPICNIARHR